MTSEQEVRTMAGWIGVEISKSRVRTPGKAGYGLYRVRGSLPVQWSIRRGETEIDRSPGQGEPTLWTEYAFTLPMIEICVEDAIQAGTPAGPGPFLPRAFGHGWADPPDATVPTRWTSAYRGRRDLGEPIAVELSEKASVRLATEMDDFVAALGEGLEMRHVRYCVCDLERESFTSACVIATRASNTVRGRQREENAAFQADHLARRAVGLVRRHAAKLARNAAVRNEGVTGEVPSAPPSEA